jgi:hypothetical protein
LAHYLVRVGVALTDRDRVGLTVPERLIVPLGLTDRVRVGDVELLGDRVRDGCVEPLELTERVRVGDAVADHVYDAFAEVEGLAVLERLTVPLTDRVGLTVPLELTDRVRVGDVVALGERVRVGCAELLELTERVRLGDVVADHVYDAFADAEGLRLTVPLTDRVRLGLVVTVTDRLTVLLTVCDGRAELLELTERVRLGDAVADHVKEAFAELDGLPVVVTLTVCDRDRVGLTVPVTLTVCDLDTVGLTDPDLDRVFVTDGVADLDAGDLVGVMERVAAAEPDRVTDGLALTERDWELVGVADQVYEAIAEVDGEPVVLRVAVGLVVALAVCVALTVAVADGITQAPAGRSMPIGPATE